MERLRDPACHMVGRDTLNPIGLRPASPEVYSGGRNKHRVSVISIVTPTLILFFWDSAILPIN